MNAMVLAGSGRRTRTLDILDGPTTPGGYSRRNWDSAAGAIGTALWQLKRLSTIG